jgi:antitoxin component of MazEF toxin-antitoxin module
MKTVKVRRVGNSNVVSLPKGLESLGFAEGQAVAVVPTKTGEIVLIPAERFDQYIDTIGRKVVAENREALDLLAAHDRGEVSTTEPQKQLA